MSETLRLLRVARVVAIFRGLTVEASVSAAEALYAAGLRAFEITLNSERPLDVIRTLRETLPDDALVGAGTVLTPDEVRAAQAAGARFIVSPNTEPDVVAATTARGLVSIPGAFTATEILRAHQAGADLVKVFPIGPVGADYVRHIRGPLPEVPLWASGGLDVSMASACLAAGCQVIGIGVDSLADSAVRRGDWSAVTVAARMLAALAG